MAIIVSYFHNFSLHSEIIKINCKEWHVHFFIAKMLDTEASIGLKAEGWFILRLGSASSEGNVTARNVNKVFTAKSPAVGMSADKSVFKTYETDEK
jgi:hypothetical protein